MKMLAPVPFAPGIIEAQVPEDAKAKDVVIFENGPCLLVEVNTLTNQTAKKVTWIIHGVRIGVETEIPDGAEYAGATFFVLPDGQVVAVAAYVEVRRVLLV